MKTIPRPRFITPPKILTPIEMNRLHFTTSSCDSIMKEEKLKEKSAGKPAASDGA